MHLYDKIGENPGLLREVGALARAKAREAGVSSFYKDPRLGEGIVEEKPDGTRHLVRRVDGQDITVSIFGAR